MQRLSPLCPVIIQILRYFIIIKAEYIMNGEELKLNISKDLKFINNTVTQQAKAPEYLSIASTENVRRLHSSIPSYHETPLVPLNSLAKKLGLKGIYVKDESYRFGLNAFKGLGGIYALSCIVCEKFGMDMNKVDFSDLQKSSMRDRLSNCIFVTATDGNHGKGVVWAATQLGCKTYVYMPQGSSENRAQAIRDAGMAEVVITDMNYDDTVRYASYMSEKNNWALLQDTSWKEYEKVPRWIVAGYTTIAHEAIEQLQKYNIDAPTHVFLQAGVGAMAGSIIGYLVNYYKSNYPAFTIVEPKQVSGIFESARQNDGLTHSAAGNGNTIMAGLNCGEPCTITWPIIYNFARHYASCHDDVAKIGMRLLAYPQGSDNKIISGESGAVTSGLLALLMEKDELIEQRKVMGLNENSIVLLINTEGDTDPISYQAIVNNESFEV